MQNNTTESKEQGGVVEREEEVWIFILFQGLSPIVWAPTWPQIDVQTS